MLARPTFELERIFSFAGLGINRQKLLAVSQNIVDTLSARINSKEVVPEDLKNFGIKVLQNELDRTKNLTDWPCMSFRLLDSFELLFSSSMLSPNCTDKSVHCSVQIDIRGG